jgi:hypothetical protein
MQIFRINLQDNTRQLIKQPALAGSGNYAMDISADGSKILILSSNADFHTTAYQLDQKTNELSTNGKDFYFTSFMMNNDNVVINLADNSKKYPFNSAVYGSGLNVKATETALIYGRSVGESRELTRVDLASEETKVLGQWLYVAGFDVLEESLVLSYEYSRIGDIVVTR